METPATLNPLLSALTLTTRRSLRPTQAFTSTTQPPITQTRRYQLARRNRKALNIPPAPSFGGPPPVNTGGSGRSHRPRHTPITQGDTIVFNPPSAAPNVYHTPSLFLPHDDPRRAMLLRANATGAARYSSVAIAPPAGTAAGAGPNDANPITLPPVIRPYPEKKYHLGPQQIEEMRRLRTDNPEEWTRTKLAEKFQCSNMFVQTVVRASEEWREKMKREEWKKMRRHNRGRHVMRGRRKEMWGRSA